METLQGLNIIIALIVLVVVFTNNCGPVTIIKKPLPRKKKKRPKILFDITIDFQTIKNVNKMAISAKIGQFSDVVINPVDRKGNPAQVDMVNFESSNTAAVLVTQDPENKLKARIEYIGIGTAEVRVKVDADLGEGIRNLEDFVAVEVKPEEAVGLTLSISDPQDNATESETAQQ